jgi:phosphopantothenoylcysteine decarboxylase/phosphopantothenate--cysteine ligase
MGYALAQAAQEAGAVVTLISGPVQIDTPAGVQCIMVETAQQMLEACMNAVEDCEIFIATAAVADYRMAHPLEQKQKKTEDALRLELTRNPDILARIAALPDGPFTLGFAAETEHLEEYARAKLNSKGLDMIAANLVGEGLAFDQDDNALEVFWANGHRSLPRQSKDRLARALIVLIAERLNHKNKIIDIQNAKN